MEAKIVSGRYFVGRKNIHLTPWFTNRIELLLITTKEKSLSFVLSSNTTKLVGDKYRYPNETQSIYMYVNRYVNKYMNKKFYKLQDK